MTAKEQLRAAVERLDEDQAPEALECIVHRRDARSGDPFLASVPLDDEPQTDDDRVAIAAAEEAIARGETIDLDAARAELE